MKVGPGVEQLTFFRDNPDFVYDRIYEENTPPGRRPFGLLSVYVPTNPAPFDWESYIARMNQGCLANHTFFLDTGFIERAPCPDEFWQFLLQRKVVLTYGVTSELTNWRANLHPSVNKQFHQALLDAHKNIELLPKRSLDTDYDLGLEYYISLLATRKDVWRFAESQLVAEGKSHDDSAIRGRIQSMVRNRGMSIAAKGFKDRGKRNAFVDEETLVSAFAHALKTGNDTTVLTRDGDFIDQLIRFQYILDSQYRAMLLAEEFWKQPDNFIKLSATSVLFSTAFETEEFYSMPAGMEERVVDWQGQGVNIHVDRIDRANQPTEFLPALFRAHREMERMFHIKGSSQGLNTDNVDNKNVHLCIQPRPHNSLPGCLAVVKDKFAVNESGIRMRWAINDVDLALFAEERTGQARTYDLSSPDANRDLFLQASQLAKRSLPRSMRAFTIANYEQIEVELLQHWFRMESPSTRIVCDESLRDQLSHISTDDNRFVELYSGSQNRADLSHAKNTALSFDLSSYWLLADYYYTLLSIRKMFGRQLIDTRFANLPRELALECVRKELLQHANGGIMHSAMEYLTSDDEFDVFGNERMVSTLAMDAISQGRKTIFVTANPAVVEQFRALGVLLHAQYLGWHLATNCRDAIQSARSEVPYIEHP